MLRQLKASAGSGKTHELTERFLELLTHARPALYTPSCTGAPARTPPPAHAWGDIMAVTFTNRAAAEMKERVVKRLKEAALGKHPLPPPWTPALAAGWIQCIIRQYGNLNIRTIDSLLQQIVSAAALELGLSPEFTPVYTSAEALAPYLDALMERAWRGDEELRMLIRECCRNLLFHANHKGFLMGGGIAVRLVSLLDYALLQGLPEDAGADALEHALAALNRDYAESARDMSHVLEKESLSAHKNFVALLAKAPELNAERPSVYLNKNGIEECLTGASRNKASRRAQDAYARLCASADTLVRQGKIVRLALEKLPFVTLVSRLISDFAEGQRRQGTLPAIRIPELARRSMEEACNVSALLCRLSSRLMHILIDEFQDTSRAQWTALRPLALEALAQGGSLTWVGDVKQAVYNWRGGDAALFDALLHDPGLRAIVPEPRCHSLPTNWRSREEIVKFNNALFSLLALPEYALNALECLLPEMPPEVIGAAAGEVSQTFTAAGQLLPDRPASRGGFVRVFPIEGDNAAELEEAVREELENSMERIAARRAWGEIAILVRSNGQAASAAAWLMEKGIPVLTENSLVLAEHPLVQQSIAFLHFVHNPLNESAFWEVCTAPLSTELSGLTRKDLHNWAVGSALDGPLYLRFRDAFPAIWSKLFAPFFPCGLMSPYDLLQEFFSRFNVMERFSKGAAFLRRLLEIAHAAEGRGYASLASFFDKWAEGGMEEKLPMPEGMDAVRVMTIHKAKGLEFPVVLVPGTHCALRPDNPITEVTLNLAGANGRLEEARVLVPRCKETGAAHYQAMAAGAREMLHLLYVAFTRATDELHVFLTNSASFRQRKNISVVLEGLLPKIGISPGKEYVKGALRATNPAFVEMDTEISSEDATADTPFDNALRTEDGAGWRPMRWLPRLRIHRAACVGTFAMRPEARGMLAHRCLEFLTPTGQARTDAERAVLLGLGASRMHLSQEQRDNLTEALGWYAALPQAASWLEHGSAEHSLLDENNTLHRVDLLVDEGDRYTVLEYKSGNVEPGHVPQVRRYLTLLERACGRRTRSVLIYLDLRRCRCVTLDSETTLLMRPEEWT
ncbi:MAG: UvrD-helicase domain-containing protein [Deltaproteobacteria bacterium]|jgi:ATP-dependent exoDNAse (exonuclease V) beta subunit|nr:UvrD-helicase domain-containing protein [Deltaproteobacteria bacterium]